MKISVIHPSFGRPYHGCLTIQRNIDRMSLAHDVEYIVVLENNDSCDNLKEYGVKLADLPVIVVMNDGMTAVSAANLGASVATGDLLVSVADDLELPWHWDMDLQDEADWARVKLGDSYVIWVSDGLPDHGLVRGQHSLITIPICSRAYMERWGYFAWPEYHSLYADNDWTERAVLADCISNVDPDRLTFRHLHRSTPFGFADDATYHHTSGRAARDIGRAVFEKRRLAGFGFEAWEGKSDAVK